MCAFFAGCNPAGSNKIEVTVRTLNTIEETAKNGDVTITKYQWSEDFFPAGEVCTLNGSKVYEHTDYTYPDSKLEFYRTDYTGGIESGHYKYVYEYTSANREHVKAIKIYSVGGEALIESKEESYDNLGRVSGYIHKKDGIVVMEYSGYDYGVSTIKYDIWDYSHVLMGEHTVSTTTYLDGYYSVKSRIVITTPEGAEVARTEYSYSGGYYSGYNKYKTVDGKSVIVEKQTDYNVSADNTTVTFVVTSYLDDGETEVSRIATKQTYDLKKHVIQR